MLLPETEHTTIKRIFKAYESKRNDGFRAHLGGSLIGAKCSRSLWFTFRWVTASHHEGRMLRLFETGQLEEARFTDDLKQAGIEIYDVGPDGNQFRVKACNGHLGGSFDGVGRGFIEAPKKWHLVEMKTHNTKSFALLKSKGVEESKPQHYAQMQIYMYLAEPQLTRAFYIAKNKDDDDLYGERVKLDKNFASRLIDKAGLIIYSAEAPEGISDKPSWFECKMCDHFNTCHGYDMPEINCRTCAHSSPCSNARWKCELIRKVITEETQRKGCDRHIYNPTFMTKHTVINDAGDDWVEYEIKGIEDRFRNGQQYYSSNEIRSAVFAGDISLLLDSNVQKFREQFNAKIEK